ncbi:SHOCT domain-containing protein [Desulfosporosinus sp. Sb-LF]|uniref:SHOCT domain-containing protein n=1 Tax=Desulfosporosinus sp. Sb-LF TaxID=2560027 RepID=UPI00107F76EB|nr:SHOCT domain-containing protein [Desulfosporosinus sp. Sb-LF]TGE34352.1 SHOCT domain-containing protein [Desulfosporosinus sp. Sb-LF]
MMLGFILIVIVVYYMINSSNLGQSCCRNNQAHAHTSLNILDERYARGEIDREEYLERKQELSGQKQSISLKKGQ